VWSVHIKLGSSTSRPKHEYGIVGHMAER